MNSSVLHASSCASSGLLVLLCFPTRRSSDLARAIHDVAFSEVRRQLAYKSDWYSKILVSCRRTDRKSTRLNSSHVSISYAVFCLKKKNLTRLLGTYFAYLDPPGCSTSDNCQR